ncbi:MAG: short-chain dehydrogenase [Rhodobiaceae bacterium]|nr:short-chain dehydrogenase [Rhodobiaceae bacterium]
MRTFKNKVALITGAASGMGKYLAINLAKEGADVVICDVNEDGLKETEKIIKSYNVGSSLLVLDVRNKKEIEELPSKIIENHGKIDLVFNNAGVVIPAGFLNMKEEDWDWCNDINYNSIINFSRSFLPHLMKDEETALINTSSIFGIITTPNNTVYHASKFAVRGFTESLIKEMEGSNTQIHCVYPGHIGTNIAVNAKFGNQISKGESKDGILGLNGEPIKDIKGERVSEEEAGVRFRDAGMDPDKAAKIILRGVKKNKKRIFVGIDSKLMELSQRLLPDSYWKIMSFTLFLGLLFSPHRLKKVINLAINKKS